MGYPHALVNGVQVRMRESCCRLDVNLQSFFGAVQLQTPVGRCTAVVFGAVQLYDLTAALLYFVQVKSSIRPVIRDDAWSTGSAALRAAAAH